MSESTTDLVTLWEAAQRVIAITGDVERATNETVRREGAAIDAELIRLGIPTRDRHGASGPGRAWWTAQNDAGRIIGIWAESCEEAVIELATSWKAPVVWCVADTDLEVRNRYPRGKQGDPCVSPLTTEPIPGLDYAPLGPLW